MLALPQTVHGRYSVFGCATAKPRSADSRAVSARDVWRHLVRRRRANTNSGGKKICRPQSPYPVGPTRTKWPTTRIQIPTLIVLLLVGVYHAFCFRKTAPTRSYSSTTAQCPNISRSWQPGGEIPGRVGDRSGAPNGADFRLLLPRLRVGRCSIQRLSAGQQYATHTYATEPRVERASMSACFGAFNRAGNSWRTLINSPYGRDHSPANGRGIAGRHQPWISAWPTSSETKKPG